MSNKIVRVAVSGAAGQIGYATVFRLANGDLLGPDTKVILQLLEVQPALPSLEGVAMELQDCAFPLLQDVVITSDPNKAFENVNWAVLIGAAPRKAGMERSDLLQMNGGIFKEQGRAINEHAADDVRVFVVGNPCNTNCLIAMHHAPDVPRDRFYAMTLLDQKRAQAMLARRAKVDVSEVTDMAIWGNHSATQFPDFYNAKIQGKPVLDVIRDEQWLQHEFVPMVQKRGAEVIKARGASSAGSAANAALYSVYNLTHETPKNDWYSVAKCSKGEYDVDEGLIFSFPSRTENGQLKVIQGIEHNDFAREKIQITLDELRAEKKAVEELGLI